MLSAQLTDLSSLRDIVTSLGAQGHKLYHLGVKGFSRATLTRANEQQPPQLYEALFQKLLGRCQALATRNKAFTLKGKIFLLDASDPLAVPLGDLPHDQGRGQTACWPGCRWLPPGV